MTQVKVLGIDPALRNFGLVRASVDIDTLDVKIEQMWLIKTDDATGKVVRKNSDDLRRAQELRGSLLLATHGCQLAIAEMPVGSQSARAMASYGISVGVLAGCPLPLIQVMPTEVKLVATGSKHATKNEMIEWAFRRHPEAEWLTRKLKGSIVPIDANEHLADAVAAIHAGIRTDQFRQAMALSRSMAA